MMSIGTLVQCASCITGSLLMCSNATRMRARTNTLILNPSSVWVRMRKASISILCPYQVSRRHSRAGVQGCGIDVLGASERRRGSLTV
ncbi:hypothetical protein BU23DRAFT_557883 [Bimuria novae-zelandiae CBS 107.79]|uniref:Uncharacterized protein n=1 Tax=Bimuria novae-zelandiae CBS 107.79 TaxID=1447943 RepID=A0A6A5UVK8_9PLEO|nr:hypothetical protein BU23DRAFT_557883 [Bimuria novae-zelandiae CBS 107.79]